MAINPVRGEVAVKIGGLEIVMVATMEGLAKLSSASGCTSLQDLYKRLMGAELSTCIAAVRIFTIRGTDADGRALASDVASKAALLALALDDAAALQAGFVSLLAALMRKPVAGEEDSNAGKTEALTQ